MICTLSRPRQLAECSRCAARLAYPNFEILVVDNGPERPSTKEMIGERYSELSNLRYEAQPLRGLSAARNRGIDVARANSGLHRRRHRRRPSGSPRSSTASTREGKDGVLMGLTLASELESRAETMFEEYGAFNRGYETRLFKRDSIPRARSFTPTPPASSAEAALRDPTRQFSRRVTLRPTPRARDEGVRRRRSGHLLSDDSERQVHPICSFAIAWHEHRRSYQTSLATLYLRGWFHRVIDQVGHQDYRIALDLSRLAPRLITARMHEKPRRGGRKPPLAQEPAPTGTVRLPLRPHCLRTQRCGTSAARALPRQS